MKTTTSVRLLWLALGWHMAFGHSSAQRLAGAVTVLAITAGFVADLAVTVGHRYITRDRATGNHTEVNDHMEVE